MKAHRASPVRQQIPIHQTVEGQNDGAQEDLKVAGEVHGVQHRQDVVFYEITSVDLDAGPCSKRILDRRQRAHPAGEFDDDAPDGRGHVRPREPPPPEHQYAAPDDEQHKRHVQRDDRVGSDGQSGGRHGYQARTRPVST